MTDLRAGLQCFHNGLPVELLYVVDGNVWRVKPLFVEGKDRDEIFERSDRITRLHTQRAA